MDCSEAELIGLIKCGIELNVGILFSTVAGKSVGVY